MALSGSESVSLREEASGSSSIRFTKPGMSLVNFELATTRCAPASRAFERASKSICEPKASTFRPAVRALRMADSQSTPIVAVFTIPVQVTPRLLLSDVLRKLADCVQFLPLCHDGVVYHAFSPRRRDPFRVQVYVLSCCITSSHLAVQVQVYGRDLQVPD